MPFLQKKSVQLTFSSLRTANCKVPSRIGGHHFLLCQQTNTKDIAGQSAKPGTARYSRAQSGKARYSQVQPGTVLKRPIMCYIFEKQAL